MRKEGNSMTFTKTKKGDSCEHEEYCNFSNNICISTDFKEHCRMKDTPIEEMHLLEKVKERVERDRKLKEQES